MMSISMDFTFIDAPTHSTDETLSKFQARISKFSGTDFWSPSTSVHVILASNCPTYSVLSSRASKSSKISFLSRQQCLTTLFFVFSSSVVISFPSSWIGNTGKDAWSYKLVPLSSKSVCQQHLIKCTSLIVKSKEITHRPQHFGTNQYCEYSADSKKVNRNQTYPKGVLIPFPFPFPLPPSPSLTLPSLPFRSRPP